MNTFVSKLKHVLNVSCAGTITVYRYQHLRSTWPSFDIYSCRCLLYELSPYPLCAYDVWCFLCVCRIT